MLVTPFVGRKGDVVCEVDGILCLFDRRGEQPKADVETEVMICASLGMSRDKRDPEKTVIAALIVQPVTADHVLIDHSGFECSGSMCRTTATVAPRASAALKALTGRGLGWITPGRTPVREVSNINIGWYGQERRAPIPAKAYVSLADIRNLQQRICGVPRLEEICPSVIARLVRRHSSNFASCLLVQSGNEH